MIARNSLKNHAPAPGAGVFDGMAPRFRLLVFDWDGTLADSTDIIAAALQSACRDIGHAVPTAAAARFVIGLGLVDALKYVAPTLPVERYPELARRYRHHYLAAESEIPLFAGAREMLERLTQDGHLLAVATGKSRAGLDRALSYHRVDTLFHATRCADEGPPKPDPAMLLYLMQRLGVKADETLMIGDTTHDLEMARLAGVAAVALGHGAHAYAELRALKPLAVCSSLAELDQLLRAGINEPAALP